jgi:AraC-like DNA-binding protein
LFWQARPSQNCHDKAEAVNPDQITAASRNLPIATASQPRSRSTASVSAPTGRGGDVTRPPPCAAAKSAFDENLLTLLLHHHPHNDSEAIAAPDSTPVPGTVRRVERYISDSARGPITASDVGAHLGLSLRSLPAGVRRWRNTTPSAHLRQVRLQLVCDELLRFGSQANVTTIAMRHGFAHLGRSSAYHREAFGEGPSATLRRARLRSIAPKRKDRDATR